MLYVVQPASFALFIAALIPDTSSFNACLNKSSSVKLNASSAGASSCSPSVDSAVSSVFVEPLPTNTPVKRSFNTSAFPLLIASPPNNTSCAVLTTLLSPFSSGSLIIPLYKYSFTLSNVTALISPSCPATVFNTEIYSYVYSFEFLNVTPSCPISNKEFNTEPSPPSNSFNSFI